MNRQTHDKNKDKQKSNKLNSDTRPIVRFSESIIEISVLAVLYYLYWKFGYQEESFPAYLGNGKFVLMGIYAVLAWLLMKNSDGFRFGDLRKYDLGIAQWIALLILNTITYFQLCLIANHMISPIPMVMLFVVDIVVSTAFIFVYSAVYHALYAPHNMVMVYGSDEAVIMKIKLDSRKDRYNVSKLISAENDLEDILKEIDHAESVILNDISAELRNDILKYCYKKQIRTYVVPKISDVLLRGATIVTAVDTPMLLIKGSGLTALQRFSKRAMDLVLSVTAMVITLPITLVTALAIKLEDGGPIFYKQKRVTRDHRVFEILKFRSMIVDAEKEGAQAATEHDPRITRVGRVIRAMRIDELPQLLNIIKGDMSLVGPRPERCENVEEYTRYIPEFPFRFKVKGGLTGFAQIYGKYNTDAYDKLRLDLMYIENYSILLDIKLLLLTVRILFSKSSTEGADVAEQNKWRRDMLLQTLDKKHHNNEEKK